MKSPYIKLTENQRWREEQRMVVAASLLAFSVGTIVLLPNHVETFAYLYLIKFPIFSSGGFALLYIVSTGSRLKFRSPGYLQAFFITAKMRRIFFDLMIEFMDGNIGYGLILGAEYAISKVTKSLPSSNIVFTVSVIAGLLVYAALIFLDYRHRDKDKDRAEFY